MKKSGTQEKGAQEEGERERRRARSDRLPEPDQNPGYRAQFSRQESSFEEEFLSSEEEIAGNQTSDVGPTLMRPLRTAPLPPVWRGLGLAVREALVRAETGLNWVLELPVPGPSRRLVLERPLIGGRRVPIEDPIWESFDQFRAEHRAAVAQQEGASQGGEPAPAEKDEEVDR